MAQPPPPKAEDLLAKIPEEARQDLLEAIRDGAKNPGEALGFGPGALEALEGMAHAYYQTHDYPRAALVFGFTLQMNPRRASGWRGLGACAHAQKDYTRAVQCYREALTLDATDIPSHVFMGEALCQAGLTEEGVKELERAVAAPLKNDAWKPYVGRAKAILAAGGGLPPTIVLQHKGKELALQTSEALASAGEPDDSEREIDWSDMQKNPELKKAVQELTRAVDEGRLTYAQVGGFTEEELHGAYAVACQYAEMGQVLKSVQIAGYLIFLDPHKGRYYQLVGICLQRMKQYELADHYYRIALALDKDDPMSLVYRGECKILAGQIDAGLAIVRDGIAAAKKNAAHAELAERGQILLKQFGT